MCLVYLKSPKHKIKVNKTSQKQYLNLPDELLIIAISFISSTSLIGIVYINKKPINDIIDLLY